MNHKIMGILSALKDEQGIDSIKKDENNFELITNLSKTGHHTYINFDFRKENDQPAPGDILVTEIHHGIASLENLNPDLLLYLLTNNYDNGLWETSSYAAIKIVEDDAYLFLNSYHYFKFEWPDKEIAEMISMVILDITGGLVMLERPTMKGIRFFTK
jgi:hypothetical protein